MQHLPSRDADALLRTARMEVGARGRISSATSAQLEVFGYNVPALERRLLQALEPRA